MVEKLVLTSDSGFETIQGIIEKIMSIVVSANAFRGEIKDIYNKSELAFLKRISESLGELEAASGKLIEKFTEIEDLLVAYNRDFDEEPNNIKLFKEGIDYGGES